MVNQIIDLESYLTAYKNKDKATIEPSQACWRSGTLANSRHGAFIAARDNAKTRIKIEAADKAVLLGSNKNITYFRLCQCPRQENASLWSEINRVAAQRSLDRHAH